MESYLAGPAPTKIGRATLAPRCVKTVSRRSEFTFDYFSDTWSWMYLDNRDGGAVIRSCENTGTRDNLWTCEDNDCGNPDVTFTLDNLKPSLRPEELSSSYNEVFGTASTTTSSTASATADTTAACAASLSSGQIAGIGAGIGVPLLIAFSAVLWLLFAEKKKRKALVATEALSEEHYPHSAHESRDYKPIKCNAELPNAGRQELSAELQERSLAPCS